MRPKLDLRFVLRIRFDTVRCKMKTIIDSRLHFGYAYGHLVIDVAIKERHLI